MTSIHSLPLGWTGQPRLNRNSQHEIPLRQGEARGGEGDLEVGIAITVHIALDDGIGALAKLAQFPGMPAEGRQSDEMEGVIARVGRVSVDAGKVDHVVTLREVGNPVAQGTRSPSARSATAPSRSCRPISTSGCKDTMSSGRIKGDGAIATLQLK